MPIDEQSYQEGRAGFENGMTLRELAQRIASAPSPAHEDKLFSQALGFADAFIDTIRVTGDIVSSKGRR